MPTRNPEEPGIFDVTGVHFLVSVSDEAQETLELASVLGRDEFSSSFYTVVRSRPRTPTESNLFLDDRLRGAFSREAGLALGVLAGGNLRELARLADVALKESECNDTPIGLAAVRSVISKEVQIFRQQLAASSYPPATKLAVWNASIENATVPELARTLFAEELDVHLRPPWCTSDAETVDEQGMAKFRLSWGRLLLRVTVARLLVHDEMAPESSILMKLQRILVISEVSPHIAAFMLRDMLPTGLDPVS